jgi:phosphatidylglycerol---prolipoprotein diacylglyceryl transferase
LDAIAPVTMIGQAIARPANFINQELYGQPTQLPWGIPIDQFHRLIQYPVSEYPVDTTRFHPTFAYEMILNLIVALFLIWYSRQYEERMKPGAMFGAWLVGAGLARSFIELFRPDQPGIPGTIITYSMIVSLLMALIGIIFLLVRYRKLNLAFAENWEEEYKIALPIMVTGEVVSQKSLPVVETEKGARTTGAVKRKPAVKAKPKVAATKAKPKPTSRKK